MIWEESWRFIQSPGQPLIVRHTIQSGSHLVTLSDIQPVSKFLLHLVPQSSSQQTNYLCMNERSLPVSQPVRLLTS